MFRTLSMALLALVLAGCAGQQPSTPEFSAAGSALVSNAGTTQGRGPQTTATKVMAQIAVERVLKPSKN